MIRITPKNVMTMLHTKPTLGAAFCREPKSGRARDRKNLSLLRHCIIGGRRINAGVHGGSVAMMPGPVRFL